MSRLDIKENNVAFHIMEGDLMEVATEDGIGHYPLSWVVAVVGEKSYVYPSHFLAKVTEFETEDDFEVFLVDSRTQCNDFIDKVKAHGSINILKWQVYVPKEMNLEEEWQNEFELENQERRHYSI